MVAHTGLMCSWRNMHAVLALCCLTLVRIPLAIGATPPPRLQALIDATPTGGTLHLASTTYQGPANITRSLTVVGKQQTVIVGNGNGTVLSVNANSVTLRGLHLRGSGDSQDRIDAGLELQGEGHRVEDIDMEDVLFGIHLKAVRRSTVKRNRVVGKNLSTGLRGDAMRVWNSQHNLIENNQFTRGRDITLINSPDNTLLNNQFTDGRYGMHVIFSPRLHAQGNRLTYTGTGIVVLYSPHLTLRGNHVAHALTAGGGGIVIRESDDSLIENNEILHCSVGLKVNTPVAGEGQLTVRGNSFAYNVIGMFFYGEAGGYYFAGNRFDNNLTTVAISAPGTGSANRWVGNQWDEYQGFDQDRNHVGDTPHELFLFADRIWMETPMASFFRNSPAFELLDFLERLAPFSSPHLVLKDERPRMP